MTVLLTVLARLVGRKEPPRSAGSPTVRVFCQLLLVCPDASKTDAFSNCYDLTTILNITIEGACNILAMWLGASMLHTRDTWLALLARPLRGLHSLASQVLLGILRYLRLGIKVRHLHE